MFYDFYNRETLLLISTLFAAMVAVSASSGRIYLPSFLAFSMPLVIPLSILHIQSSSDTLWLTGFLLLIEDMSSSAQALNGLFNSLLDVSKLDAEIIHFNPTHVDIGEMFDGLQVQFKNSAAEKGLDLITEHRDCTLHADSILLERVLRNLLSNAVSYTHSGTVSLVCDSSKGDVATISVSDTGLGMPEHEHDNVFTEYHQLNNPERDRNKGLGLGLAIVKRLCHLMKLDVKMHSELGVGTRFDISVPIGDANKIQALPAEVGVLPVQNATVMVIDDEEAVLAGMESMLGQWGCKVVVAESARDALRAIALEQVNPDIVISDYRLRNNCTGVDAIATVREALEIDIPGIIVTGDNSPTRLKEVNESGLHLLHKPVNPDEMRSAIARVQ